jgi:hypothetical protein
VSLEAQIRVTADDRHVIVDFWSIPKRRNAHIVQTEIKSAGTPARAAAEARKVRSALRYLGIAERR